MNQPLSRSQEIAARVALARDFPLYAKNVLRIRTKAGAILPLILNRAQRRAHEAAERQLIGKKAVRNIILKARQQGLSTLIEARFFWKVTHRRGVRAYILTHEAEATANLFGMVERYYQHAPPELRPSLGASNAKELQFDVLDSGYKVGTAGAKATGRSQTVQLFHGSEVAFWPNAEEHVSGVLQSIPSGEQSHGTEIWIESTANGMGNWYQRTWAGAVAGDNDFEPIFIPWFWDEGYRMPADDLRLSSDEEEIQARYSLSREQMAWRQWKLRELGDLRLFMQEYPAEAVEAFDQSADKALILREPVIRAMHQTEVLPYGAMVLGVDPARFGGDKTAMALREGRVCHWVKQWSGIDTMETVGRVMDAVRAYRVKQIFVDGIGIGAGVVDRLRELGAPVVEVTGSARAMQSARYKNKRAEDWASMKQWLNGEAVQLPLDNALADELTSLHYKFDSKSRLVLESKDEALARGVRSPNLADALSLTFSAPVGVNDVQSFEPGATQQGRASIGGGAFDPEW